MSNHTPGPWNAEVYCIWAGGTFVAGTQTGISKEEQLANARLIAAAPDLLETLSNVVWKLDRNTDSGPAKIDRNDSVIRKAAEVLEKLNKQ